MSRWRGSRIAAAVVAALIPVCMVVAAPSAGAAQGCSSTPTFCAWERPSMEGDVINVVDPEVSSPLAPVLGERVCYDLHKPRQSTVNDTGYQAVMYANSNCGGLIVSTLLPGERLLQTLPFQSVLFLPL
ncbi:peptidase inhibitor family I36 protein [Saccharothrix syringae]|uniref:Uncharacterized protein n=1 Tax=Saccharothrix syringae TaxID=103733 RepID=A0A5Q0GYF0_SACSY|nr:peptidase inhibitor family I36 protein [Saccharothrix syringae]QFZ18695.1 hypothetical protein EKG83_15600 [Saccharothrix syringae]